MKYERILAPRPDWFFWYMAIYAAWHILLICLFAFDFITHPLAPDPQFGSMAFRFAICAVMLPLGLVVSTLVIRRAPGNVTGLCLLLLLALIMGMSVRPDSQFAGGPGSGTLGALASATNSGWTGLWLLGIFFPSGRAAFRRSERPIRVLAAAAILIIAFWAFVQPVFQGQPNPVYIPALAPLTQPVNALENILGLPIIILIPPSLIYRYVKGDGPTRLQLKWLAWVFGVLFLMVVPLGLSGLIGPMSSAQLYAERGLLATLAMMIFVAYIAVAPFLAVGNAILRHRLYDIDIIIRRTLVYTAVTVLLALVFYGSVLLLQQSFTALSGEQSPVAIVASTLIIAALFSPLRRRVQDFADRRFYRRKYDAQQVLAQFAAVARDETDLDRLTLGLVGAMESALQPAHVEVRLAGQLTDFRP